MGRKKRKAAAKPFCYYCNRFFEEEKVLIQHQKAKHFKCDQCHKKMGTAYALMNHMFQVHKKQLKKVPNAKPGRDEVSLSIYGMQGVPEEIVREMSNRITSAVATVAAEEKVAAAPAATSTAPPPEKKIKTQEPAPAPLNITPSDHPFWSPPQPPRPPQPMYGGFPQPGFGAFAQSPPGFGFPPAMGRGMPTMGRGMGMPGMPMMGGPMMPAPMGRGVPPPMGMMPRLMPMMNPLMMGGMPPRPEAPPAAANETKAPPPPQSNGPPPALSIIAAKASSGELEKTSSTGSAAAASATKSTGVTEVGKKGSRVYFVYKNPEDLSMEESRASLPQYQFSAEALQAEASRLSDSIQQRLKALQNR